MFRTPLCVAGHSPPVLVLFCLKSNGLRCSTLRLVPCRRTQQCSLAVHFSDSNSLPPSRWPVFPVAARPLLCYPAVEVSGRSSGALLLRTAIEWGRRRLMVLLITRPPSGTTPPTSILSTAACSLSACRAEEGKCVSVCVREQQHLKVPTLG